MNKETLKQQLLDNIDSIVNIVLKDNSVEIRQTKNGVLIYEICRNKLNIKSEK